MKIKNLCLSLALAVPLAHATPVEFVPPSDPVGAVFTNNSNDGYDIVRGIVFLTSTEQIIDSIGIYLDVTDTLLNWFIYQTVSIDGDIATGQTLLQSGSLTVSTTGLEWVDVAIAPQTLAAGGMYQIAFSHVENANQNFYYNDGNNVWTQGAFSALNGTQDGDTGNSVTAAIRVNLQDSGGVPEPASLLLTAGALAVVYGARRRFVRY